MLSAGHAADAYGAMVGTLLFAGIALAFATPGVVTAATASVPSERAGMASAVNNTARRFGGAVGVAAIGGIAGAGGFTLRRCGAARRRPRVRRADPANRRPRTAGKYPQGESNPRYQRERLAC